MNTSKINMLHVITGLHIGGVEKYLLNVIRLYNREKYNMIVCCTDTNSTSGPYALMLKSSGVKVVYCKEKPIFGAIQYIKSMMSVVKENSVDVICDYRNDFAGTSVLAGALAGIKGKVALYRSKAICGKTEPSLFLRIYVLFLRGIIRFFASAVISNSQETLNSFFPRWQKDKRFYVVRNGVEVDGVRANGTKDLAREKLGIPGNKFVIGHVGNFRETKNHKTILKTIAAAKKKVPNIHLILIGDGKLRKEIETGIKEYGIEENTTLAGRREDIGAMLAAMDMFIFPSTHEGMPNALLEAMAAGLPFVASDIPEIVEIMPDDLRGQLCGPFDADKMADIIYTLYRDIGLREKIGDRARLWVKEQFPFQRAVDNLLERETLNVQKSFV